jgi:hypothetical protein
VVAVATTNSPSRFRRPSGATLATERLPRRLDSEVLDEEEEVQEAIVASLLDSEASQADVCPTSSSSSSSSSKAASAGAVGAAYASNFSSGSASSRDTSAKKKIRVEKEPKA